MNKDSPQVVFIVGPTASGKSTLALELAESFGGAIINADSIQVYRGLDIGSAKPTPAELQRVRHFLVGHVADGADYTAAAFREDCLQVLNQGDYPVYWVVGGSGFYIRALVTGLDPITGPAKDYQQLEALHKRMARSSTEYLFKELECIDAERAGAIHPNDRYRIQRALEIYYGTGLKPSDVQKERACVQEEPFPFASLFLGMKVCRDELRLRVRKRAEQMLQSGLIDEVKKLRAQGLGEWRALKSVGYREVGLLLDGQLSQDELIPMIETKTMQLAKRQMTWFRKQDEIQWYNPHEKSEIEKRVKAWLKRL